MTDNNINWESQNITKGRCWTCNRAYYWKRNSKHKLKNTQCPRCGKLLHATVHYLKSVPHYKITWDNNNIALVDKGGI